MSTSSDITEFSSSEVVIGRLEEEMLIVDRLREEGGRRPRSWQTVCLLLLAGEMDEPGENLNTWFNFRDIVVTHTCLE